LSSDYSRGKTGHLAKGRVILRKVIEKPSTILLAKKESLENQIP
jgi:hypothetical protein